MKAPYLVIVLGFLIGNTNTVLLIPFHRGVLEKQLEIKRVIRPELPDLDGPPDPGNYNKPLLQVKGHHRGLR